MSKDKDEDEDFDMFKLGFDGLIAWAEETSKEKKEREK